LHGIDRQLHDNPVFMNQDMRPPPWNRKAQEEAKERSLYPPKVNGLMLTFAVVPGFGTPATATVVIPGNSTVNRAPFPSSSR
jgi:hypothetical protein